MGYEVRAPTWQRVQFIPQPPQKYGGFLMLKSKQIQIKQ